MAPVLKTGVGKLTGGSNPSLSEYKKVDKVKIENIKKYFDAVDVVCINCHYLSEGTCENCPVRKTCDDIYNKQVLSSN